MRNILLLFASLFLLPSCNHKTSGERLAQIDSVLTQELYDSAYSLIAKIDTGSYSEGDKAYYFLLRNHILYRLNKSEKNDSSILRSIKYYKGTEDKEKLVRAYIGRCELYNNPEENVKYLKEAENISKGIDNLELRTQVYAHLSYINHVTGNLNKALEYGRMALDYAKTINNKHWIGYCLDNLGWIYYSMKQYDKRTKYTRMTEPYVKYQPKKNQVHMLDNLATEYWAHGEYDKAEDCLKKSLKILPMDRTYGLLAELYAKQGKESDFEALWKKALYSEHLYTRQYTMLPYAKWLYGQKRYEEAWDIVMQIPDAIDSLNRLKQSEVIKDLQDNYDHKLSDIRHEHEKRIVLMGIGILAVFLLAVWLYYHQKTQEAKKHIAENQVLMTSYTLKIKKLEKEGKEQSKEAKDLRLRLNALRDRQAEVLYKGKEKFESIKNGGKANTWHKADYNDVVEYYRTINMPFVISLEQDYKSLPASNKFFLLLTEELGFDDSEICRVMGLTDGALRTMRYRIKKAHEPALSL